MIEVLALLLQVLSDGTFAIASEPVRTTIEECLKMAAEINSNVELPFIVVCTADPSAVAV